MIEIMTYAKTNTKLIELVVVKLLQINFISLKQFIPAKNVFITS